MKFNVSASLLDELLRDLSLMRVLPPTYTTRHATLSVLQVGGKPEICCKKVTSTLRNTLRQLATQKSFG
jgi:hypothetical protein